MQTEGLTWEQAKNMLLTGVATVIGYDQKYCGFANYFTAVDGEIACWFCGGREDYDPGGSEYKFCVME